MRLQELAAAPLPQDEDLRVAGPIPAAALQKLLRRAKRDVPNVSDARRAFRDGASDNEVWADHQLFRHPSGQMYGELPYMTPKYEDLEQAIADFAQSTGRGPTMPDMFDAGDLFDLVPELRGISVGRMAADPSIDGQYSPFWKTMAVNPMRNTANSAPLDEIMQHEGLHAIQDVLGIPLGTGSHAPFELDEAFAKGQVPQRVYDNLRAMSDRGIYRHNIGELDAFASERRLARGEDGRGKISPITDYLLHMVQYGVDPRNLWALKPGR